MTVQEIVDGAQALTCCLPRSSYNRSIVYLLNQILSGAGGGAGISLLANLYDHWTFDNTLAGVNGHNFVVTVPVFQAGHVTSLAIRFNAGTPANAGIAPNTAADLIATTPISFALWFNLVTLQTAAANQLVGNSVGVASGMEIRGRTGPSLTIQVLGSSTTNSPTVFVLGNWVFVAAGFDTAAPSRWITINGAAKTTAGLAASDATPVNNLYIGNDPTNPAQTCDMLMNSLSIWRGKVLSAADIAYLYNAGAGRRYPFFV